MIDKFMDVIAALIITAFIFVAMCLIIWLIGLVVLHATFFGVIILGLIAVGLAIDKVTGR